MDFKKIDLSKMSKSKRVNPLDSVDSQLRNSFEQIKNEQGIEHAYDTLLNIYGDGMKNQIDLLIKESN